MEEIRADIDETRASLADKLEALQEKALGTVEAAQATVEQTVTTVQETVAAAKRTFDLRYQTEQNPWLMVGLATVAGSVAGCFLFKSRQETPPSKSLFQVGSESSNGVASAATPAIAPPSAPGLFADEWRQLKGMAISAGMAMARDWLKESAPGLTDQIETLMNSATHKLGGTPVQGSVSKSRPTAYSHS